MNNKEIEQSIKELTAQIEPLWNEENAITAKIGKLEKKLNLLKKELYPLIDNRNILRRHLRIWNE